MVEKKTMEATVKLPLTACAESVVAFGTKVQLNTNIKITGGKKDSAADHSGLMGFACSANTNMSLTDFALA